MSASPGCAWARITPRWSSGRRPDYRVLFPTSVMTMVPFMRDAALRRGGTRALNTYAADLFREYADRMTPVAGIPIHTPQEAIEELEHVKSLGLKVVMLAGLV